MEDSVGLTNIEIFFAFMAILFTALLGLFFNYMRLLIKKEQAAEQAARSSQMGNKTP